MAEKSWVYVTDEDAVPPGEGRRVSCQGLELALVRAPSGWFALDNACPHRQGPLADGIVAGKTVFCPLHSWKISLETGCALAGGEGRVKTYPVRVADGKVFVSFEGDNQ
jgi:nitrite reductase (NADH) small subunit